MLCPEIYRQTMVVEAKDCIHLESIGAARNFMVDLCALMDVRIIEGPHVVGYEDPEDSKKSGISGTTVFAESGMHLHTWPYYGFLRWDCWSCKPFSSLHVRQAIMQWYSPMAIEVRCSKP